MSSKHKKLTRSEIQDRLHKFTISNTLVLDIEPTMEVLTHFEFMESLSTVKEALSVHAPVGDDFTV